MKKFHSSKVLFKQTHTHRQAASKTENYRITETKTRKHRYSTTKYLLTCYTAVIRYWYIKVNKSFVIQTFINKSTSF